MVREPCWGSVLAGKEGVPGRNLQEIPPDKSVSAGYGSAVVERTTYQSVASWIVWMGNDPTVWWLLSPASYFWFVKHLSAVTREVYMDFYFSS